MKPSMPCEWARGAWNRSLSGSLLQRKSMEMMNGGLMIKKTYQEAKRFGALKALPGSRS